VRARPPSFAEFVVLVALMFAMIAFGTDTMLPSLPEIARDLGLGDVNRAQLIITSFVLGTGIGQLFMGPLSDSLGRKPVISGGLVLYMAACIVAYGTRSFEWLLVARFVQGIGVSAPRTVTLAMVRDLYAGRMMARVMSFAMMLFVLVPAVAPLLGQRIALSFGWRAIFLAFILFALVGLLWLGLRQPETLVPGKRRPLSLKTFGVALGEVLTSRVVLTYTAVLAFGYGALFGYLSSAQQVFVDVFGVGRNFPLYFAGIALLSGLSGFINGALVLRLGMRALATGAFGVMLAISIAMLLIVFIGGVHGAGLFPLFLIWSLLAFVLPGLTFGNLNALALEPMGHIAGMASAFVGAISTLFGVLIAVPIGLAFNGSATPLFIGFAICSGASFLLMLSNPKANDAAEFIG